MAGMNNENIEILAPVGSWESLAAAIQAKAQSVYFGIEHLNMRFRSSNNFRIDDLKQIVEKCHSNGIKAYLTLNTIIYEEEIALMKNIVDAAKKNNIDAIIASDQSVINYCFEKTIPLHLSTQLNISNYETVKFYAPYADVMVLARELSLEQISNICNSIASDNLKGPSGKPVKIEVFIHGALCMSVSGKCYLSEHLHGASANRGACYQICRREFTVKDDNENTLVLQNPYILSPKDLCTIRFLDKILEAGVQILKIEGRGRSPEYVKKCTEVYRKAVIAIENNSFDAQLAVMLEKELETVFNRGFWEGHYLGQDISLWNTDVYGSKAARKKTYAAKGVKYFSKIGVGEFLMESGTLQRGDKILIIGPTTGVIELIIEELHFENQLVESVSKGDRFSIRSDHKIRASDKLYRLEEQ